MKRGFTILELLVASLLLSMLVTMLSMMFNQSSVAWRTGVAGVVELNDVRSKMGTYHEVEDEILPGVGSGGPENLNYRTVSLWQNGRENTLRVGSRAVQAVDWGNAPSVSTRQDAERGVMQSIGSSRSPRSVGAIVVGVRSWGPDRKPNTDDDITNWPEEVD